MTPLNDLSSSCSRKTKSPQFAAGLHENFEVRVNTQRRLAHTAESRSVFSGGGASTQRIRACPPLLVGFSQRLAQATDLDGEFDSRSAAYPARSADSFYWAAFLAPSVADKNANRPT